LRGITAAPAPDGTHKVILGSREQEGRILRIDPNLDPHPLLVSTRTLEFALWNPREFYTGGYDGAANNRKNHNTAWIDKGTLKTSNGDKP
jgi:hypothetical protein